MRCMMCGVALSKQAVAIFRLNNKGQKGIWACKAHYDEAKAKHFPDDDPSAPAPMRDGWDDGAPKGPWTGGVTPMPPKRSA